MKGRRKKAVPTKAKKNVRRPLPQPKDSQLEALRQELKSIEARFRSLVDTAAAPILLLSPQLNVLEMNPEAERLYGRRRKDVVGRGYFAALDPEGRGGLSRTDFMQVLRGQPLRGVEGKARHADGTERVLVWNSSRLRNPGGTTGGVIAVAQDITERQMAEEALREREARLSMVISTAPDAIITIDADAMVQSFSTAAEKLFGYMAGEVVGRNVNMLMPSPYQEEHDGYIQRYLRTGEKRIIGIGREVQAKRKDGTVFPIELAVGEVKLGETRIFTGFIRDLTARARMELELRQAQKMEAVGQLTGGLAHDFNNLLTVITGNLEMLESKVERPEQRELLAEAQEAAALGAKLASRLLAFGRRQPLNPRLLDISALVGGIADLLRRSLGASVQIETRLAPGLPLALVDPGQAENALLNLAINARDAMPKGGSLIVETRAVEFDGADAMAHGVPPGAYVALSVTDTGVGMSPEVRQRAFEPFYTTKEGGRGSGLGLSMVYGFVKQSGGHVQLYSELGRGTTVRIYLPARGGEAQNLQWPIETAGPAKGENILVVEDDRLVRSVTVRRLKELGYKVTEVSDARMALDALERDGAFDLLFTDIVMPGGMSGIELAREARRRRPQLRVLYTSGFAEPAAVERGLLASKAAWLGKPYSARELAQKLRELLAS